MAVFEEQATRRFDDRMLQHIAAGFPERFSQMGEAGALAYVRDSAESAARYGMVTALEVGVFIMLKLEFGETFEISPDREWARKILEHPTLPGSIKAMEIAARLFSGTEGRRMVRRPAIR